MAVLLALKSFQSFIAEREVTIFSDNQNVVRIVHNGSSVGHLQRIAVDIFSFYMSHASFHSHQLSRIVDPDDWSLSLWLSHLIVDKWGSFHFDRMASRHNSHLPRFNSKFWCPGTCFSKVPRTFRARKASCQTAIRLF